MCCGLWKHNIHLYRKKNKVISNMQIKYSTKCMVKCLLANWGYPKRSFQNSNPILQPSVRLNATTIIA